MKRLLSLLLALTLGMFSYQVSAQQNDGNMTLGNGSVTTDPMVTTAPVSNLSPDAATLNAIIMNPDNVNISEMGFEWRKVMGGYNTTVTGTGNGNMFSATLNNLTPNTSYLYKAYIFFNGTTIYGEEVYFTTPEEGSQCPAPTNLIAYASTSSVTLLWQQETNTANEWEVRYRQATESDWSVYNTTSTTITLEDLVPDTDYEAYVVAHCTNSMTSEPSNTVTFHTEICSIQDYLEHNLILYPNPATDMVSVSTTDANIRITGVEVYNVYGQLLNAMVPEENPMCINVCGLADGMYFVRVTTGSGVVTKSFVKK